MRLNIPDHELEAMKQLLEDGKLTELRKRDPNKSIVEVANKYLDIINNKLEECDI